jgi:hypothetical protein
LSIIDRTTHGKYLLLEGNPRQLGYKYGSAWGKRIRENRHFLLNARGWGCNVLDLKEDPDFQKWIGRREQIIGDNWPWLLEEFRGIAAGCGMDYREILMLNVRAWWYPDAELIRRWGHAGDAGRPAAGDTQCTALATKLTNGTIACAGGLDDGAFVYGGAVLFRPENGYGFLSFPICGTVWGSLGMNSQGLFVGAASASFVRRQVAVLEKSPTDFDEMNSDIVMGVILRTCRTAAEAKELAGRFPYNGNLMCVDRGGDVVMLQNTPAGPITLPFEDCQVFTNHMIFDEDFYDLHGSMDLLECAPGPNVGSRIRRGYVSAYLQENRGKLDEESFARFVGTRVDRIPGMSVHSGWSLAVGYAQPQLYPSTFFGLIPQDEEYCDRFVRYDIS